MKFLTLIIVALVAISSILFTVEAAPTSAFPIVFAKKDLKEFRDKVEANLFKNVKFICDDKNVCGTPEQVKNAKREITFHLVNILEDNFSKTRYSSLKELEDGISLLLRRSFLTLRGFGQSFGIHKPESLSALTGGCAPNIRNPLKVVINKLRSQKCNSNTSVICKKREDAVKQTILREFNFI